MNGNWFENITAEISFTYLPPPSFKEKNPGIIQTIVIWNDHKKDVFVP